MNGDGLTPQETLALLDAEHTPARPAQPILDGLQPCTGCDATKAQCVTWKRDGFAGCCPDCRHAAAPAEVWIPR